MKEKLYDEIVLTKDAQGENLSKALGDLLLLLMKEENVCKVYDDDGSGSVIVVQFNHDERIDYWGSPSPEWVTSDELESLERMRAEDVFPEPEEDDDERVEEVERDEE